jgi:Ca2+-binding RTX toxin-like protein
MLKGALLALGIGVPLWVAVTPATAATGTCDGVTGKVRNANVVRGGPGNDLLIGGPGPQRIFGGPGDDLICAGDRNDVIHGGGGNDAIHGEGRGDFLFGDRGSDRLYGDVLDDKLFGGPGPDSLIGGQGADRMFGGPGDDLLRGGINRDCYLGQGGTNTASFATATPPGPASGISGVLVELDHSVRIKGCPTGTGLARGDGNGVADAEPLNDIQFVVGSAFSDLIQGGPRAGLDAGLGDDSCTGFASGASAGCGGGDEKPAGIFSYVFQPASPGPPDPGLIIRADDGPSDDVIGVPATPAIGYALVYAGGGADSVTVGEGLPPDATVDLDGGPGDDRLTGGPEGDVLLGGDSPGADIVSGNGGDDALVSAGGDTSAGPDALSGGTGDDQLVAAFPCAGDTFSGGPGDDIAGFALSGVGIRARMGGLATLPNGTCPGGSPTAIAPDNEVLEGSNEADRLIGSVRPETIWAREGNDVVVGNRGADDLEGFAGRDLIDARDGVRDRKIDCGSGHDRATRDHIDPPAIKC